MALYQSQHCDVFAPRIGAGNPLAVILQADALSTVQMQAIADWMNLAETTFVLKPTLPEADYRVRIFTTKEEIAFAGQPSTSRRISTARGRGARCCTATR